MNPFSHTLYTGALFLALLSVLLWINRRCHASAAVRRSVSEMAHQDKAA